jgi:hypothetical protein
MSTKWFLNWWQGVKGPAVQTGLNENSKRLKTQSSLSSISSPWAFPFQLESGEVIEAALRFHQSPTPIQVVRLSSVLDRMHRWLFMRPNLEMIFKSGSQSGKRDSFKGRMKIMTRQFWRSQESVSQCSDNSNTLKNATRAPKIPGSFLLVRMNADMAKLSTIQAGYISQCMFMRWIVEEYIQDKFSFIIYRKRRSEKRKAEERRSRYAKR